ncbi:MAG: hypothetical protein ACRC2H_11945, partial [Silanimonas sp.]
MMMELRLVARSRLVLVAALAVAVLMTLALLSGIAQVRRIDTAMQTAVDADRTALDEIQANAATAPLDAGMFGYATLFAVPHPPAPGAWVNLGDTAAQPP